MLIVQPYRQSIQESSEDFPSSNSIQVIHHVLNIVLGFLAVDRVSVSKWMEYMRNHNINELCDDLQFEYPDYSDYIVNEQNCEQNISIIHKIRQFISWMSTTKKETTFDLFSEYLL